MDIKSNNKSSVTNKVFEEKKYETQGKMQQKDKNKKQLSEKEMMVEAIWLSELDATLYSKK